MRRWPWLLVPCALLALALRFSLHPNRALEQWEELPGVEGLITRAEALPAERRHLNDLFYGARKEEVPWAPGAPVFGGRSSIFDGFSTIFDLECGFSAG